MCTHNVDELVSARSQDYMIQQFSGARFLGFSLFCGFGKYVTGAVLFYFRNQEGINVLRCAYLNETEQVTQFYWK